MGFQLVRSVKNFDERLIMKSIKQEIISQIEAKISEFEPTFGYANIGKIIRLGDGVATMSGLSKARIGEVVEFESGMKGLVLNLKKDEVGVIVFDEYENLKEGEGGRLTGEIFSIEASESYLGRVINPLGKPVDGGGRIVHRKNSKFMPVEKIAPGIVFREPVTVPLQTGIKAIDAMIPIGRGQRELIIGDRNTGKTTLVVDTIINQSRLNKKNFSQKKVISIYVSIGQKQSKLAQLVARLEDENAMDETIVVAANSSDSVALQYIAPYVGCAISEYFMEKGEDVLIAYDDLTKHAWAYRQISLILRRPSGREAYPGDIFYLHSRLLERACKLNEKYGGGSITALPIIETQAQDISAYIPTNVISITDGQIYLENDLFFQGIRPAINPGLSVSRVGGAAQLKSVKQVAGKLRLELASYNELSAFAQFGSDLDPVSRAKIERGKRIIEVFKQPQYDPIPLEVLVLELWFTSRGYLDEFEVSEANSLAKDFASMCLSKYKDFEKVVYSKEGITEEVEKKLQKFAIEFVNSKKE